MTTDLKKSLKNLTRTYDAAYCMACGKCSAVCPVTSREHRDYESPRMLVESLLAGAPEKPTSASLLWSCLTCTRCSGICPSDVGFINFIRDVRNLFDPSGRSGTCTHGEMMESWARLMTDPALSQRRLDWITPDLKISDSSDTLYFTGCLPHYERVFENLAFEGTAIASAAVKILNHLGIIPRVMADERCCGHDRLFQGDRETFLNLARLNIDLFSAAGITRIITTCPECARTLKLDYPTLAEDHGITVMHLTQLLQDHLSEIPLPEDTDIPPSTVTFHDACRLGRHMGIYDAPRAVLSHLGATPLEMTDNRQKALCCGTTCWSSCGQVSKQIQTDRLKQAGATGAKRLVTACPKCQIHLKCAQNDPEMKPDMAIPVQDITTWVAERMPRASKRKHATNPRAASVTGRQTQG